VAMRRSDNTVRKKITAAADQLFSSQIRKAIGKTVSKLKGLLELSLQKAGVEPLIDRANCLVSRLSLACATT
jgi:hypothetical protein